MMHPNHVKFLHAIPEDFISQLLQFENPSFEVFKEKNIHTR